MGVGLYGAGFLLSDRAAAERAAAFKYELSERELAMVKEMNKHDRRSEEKDS